MFVRVISLLCLLIPFAFAEGGFYTGIGIGYSGTNNNVSPLQFTSNNPNGNASGSGIASNLYFGYDFNHYVGIQTEYDITYPQTIANSYNVDQQIFGLALMAHLPFSIFSDRLSGLSVFAKGGMAYEIAGFSGGGGCANCSNPTTQNAEFVPLYGLGVEYGFTNWGYRLEWDGVGGTTNTGGGINQTSVSSNMYLISIMYHF